MFPAWSVVGLNVSLLVIRLSRLMITALREQGEVDVFAGGVAFDHSDRPELGQGGDDGLHHVGRGTSGQPDHVDPIEPFRTDVTGVVDDSMISVVSSTARVVCVRYDTRAGDIQSATSATRCSW